MGANLSKTYETHEVHIPSRPKGHGSHEDANRAHNTGHIEYLMSTLNRALADIVYSLPMLCRRGMSAVEVVHETLRLRQEPSMYCADYMYICVYVDI